MINPAVSYYQQPCGKLLPATTFCDKGTVQPSRRKIPEEEEEDEEKRRENEEKSEKRI